MSNIMRLINIDDLTLRSYSDIEKDPQNDLKYAILSHRWNERPRGMDEEVFKPWNEVLYNDYPKGNTEDDRAKRERWLNPVRNNIPFNTGEGKIAWACYHLRNNKVGPRWLWMDTACIDKSNKVELDEAINSMMRWYRKAFICVAYLKDVSKHENEHNKACRQRPGEDAELNSKATTSHRIGDYPQPLGPFIASEWFDRGWTLQELLAPPQVQFFDYRWDPLGSRERLRGQIEEATGIQGKYLDGFSYLQPCIAVKLSWMARRFTSKLEDTAYCLLGILNQRMTVNYGEREGAFLRLQEKLVTDTRDESVFAWIDIREQPDTSLPGVSRTYGLLAPWPSFFVHSGSLTIQRPKEYRKRPDYSVGKGGVLFPLPMKYPDDGNGIHLNNRQFRKLRNFKLSLNCWVEGKSVDKHVTLELTRESEHEPFRRQLGPRMLLEKCSQSSFDRLAGTNKTRETHIPNIGSSATERLWMEEVIGKAFFNEGAISSDMMEESNHKERKGFRRLLFGD
ncbi:hypothetical protein NW762_007954 [Fusarium torreyae]|uniref:Heterokaryon incompatibility domain-containing protein n=1 Tax=Fusarium torreyae TaxID=1237075 RepID=A0A9W8VFT7_9HYPO|nr:hypothetical protein NW762_007954 [Fusarium torreyae]